MIAVLFEVVPNADRRRDYLDIAASLRPRLETIDGFISIERFESLVNPGKILSLSYWRDERAVAQWREDLEHRHAQQRGREEIFARYTIRVAAVVRERRHPEEQSDGGPLRAEEITSVPRGPSLRSG